MMPIFDRKPLLRLPLSLHGRVRQRRREGRRAPLLDLEV
jgi:hypothetical protein